jgi:NTP pyrophosphatase (non-canonical NTP hydrolase)
MDLTQSYEHHLQLYGEGHLLRVEDQLVEECAELITLLLRRRRSDRVVSDFDLQSELADVEICIAFFKKSLDKDAYEKVLKYKLDRLKIKLLERIDG